MIGAAWEFRSPVGLQAALLVYVRPRMDQGAIAASLPNTFVLVGPIILCA